MLDISSEPIKVDGWIQTHRLKYDHFVQSSDGFNQVYSWWYDTQCKFQGQLGYYCAGIASGNRGGFHYLLHPIQLPFSAVMDLTHLTQNQHDIDMTIDNLNGIFWKPINFDILN